MSVAEKTEKKSGGLGETVSVIIQALLLALVIRTLLFQPFSIPSGSMRPTLLEGDYLFVTKWAYGYSRHSLPFSPPTLFRPHLGHRAAARRRGGVQVSAEPLARLHQARDRPARRQDPDARTASSSSTARACRARRSARSTIRDITEVDRPVDVYRETLPNGVSYDTLDLTPNSIGDNTREFVVPAGHYFMMGDNRDNSTDSRFSVGFVPEENLVGRANIIFFSIADGASPLEIWKWPSLMRASRLLHIRH